MSSRIAPFVGGIMVGSLLVASAAAAPEARAGVESRQRSPADARPTSGFAPGNALAAIRDRVATLPQRSCGLRVRWHDYLDLLDAIISDGGAESPAIRERVRKASDDLDRFITAYAFLSNALCKRYDANTVAQQKFAQQRRLVGSSLTRAIAAIRGNVFPFETPKAFAKLYQERHLWPRRPDTHWPSAARLTVTKQGRATVEMAWEFLRVRTSVSNGLVAVDPRGGKTTVTSRFFSGRSFSWGSQYLLREEFPAGFQLEAPLEAWEECDALQATRPCWGNTDGLVRRPTPRYRPSRVFLHGAEAALQAHVTATCVRTVRHPAAMLQRVKEYLPRDRSLAVRRVFATFLDFVERAARIDADALCAPGSSELMERLAAAAVTDVMGVGQATVDSIRLRLQHLESQRLINEVGDRLIRAYASGGADSAAAAQRSGEG